MKKIVLILFCLLFITGCDDENTYKIELNNEPYTICGEDIYFSNFTDSNGLNIGAVIDEINDVCDDRETRIEKKYENKIEKYEQAFDNICDQYRICVNY